MISSSCPDARKMSLNDVRQPDGWDKYGRRKPERRTAGGSLNDVWQAEGWTAYDRPEGGTNITPGDRSPKGEGTRGKRHLCFGRPEGGTTYGGLKSSTCHHLSHVDRHYQWVTGYESSSKEHLPFPVQDVILFDANAAFILAVRQRLCRISAAITGRRLLRKRGRV